MVLGNIRPRRGDLTGAEEAYLAAHREMWSPEPGLALLRLAQGHVGVAADLIAEAIEYPVDEPSKERPPFGDLRLAPLLSAQAEIAAAAGDTEVARRAAQSLEAIAARYPSRGLAADAFLADGRVALLGGNCRAAIAACSQAVSTWAELGAPFETAAARMVLGQAHRKAGNRQQALLEWEAARVAFDEFGAALDTAKADDLVRTVAGEPQPHRRAAREPERATFALVGNFRRIAFIDDEVLLPDLKGFHYLARLLAEPGREFHALDLVASQPGVAVPPAEHGLPILDEQARAAYRRRLAEVEEDIDDATATNDMARRALAQRDREFLVAELKRAVGLGGRAREVGGSTERARTSVTRTLRYALRRLGDQHPELGQHLDRAVRTGIYCSYSPDSIAPVHWDLDG